MSTEPGPELDRLVAKEVMKWETWDSIFDVPPYSTDIEAAWEVMEHMAKQGWAPSVMAVEDHWMCDPSHVDCDFSEALTAPLAICLAALEAVKDR